MFSDEATAQTALSATTPETAAGDSLIKKFEIFASREEIEKETDLLAQKYCQKVKLPGFRQGKVPVEIVKSTYKKALSEEVLEQLIRRLAFAHIEKNKLSIAAAPVAEKVDYVEGGDMKAQIAVEVFPEVVLPEIEGLKIEIPEEKLKAEEFDEARQVDRFLQAHERSVPVNGRGLQEGDLALFSMQARFLDSKRMSAKKDSYFLMKKEGETEITGLFDELLGKKADDKVTIARSYAADHGKKAWAGKEIEHLLEIKNVYELKKPELDPDFLKSIGVASEEEFRKKLRDEFDQHSRHLREDVILEHIFDRLADLVQIAVPSSLVQQEIRSRLARQQAPLKFSSDEEKDKFRKELMSGSQRSVKLSLILDEIRRKYGIEVQDEDMQKEYRHLAQHHNVQEKDVRRYYADKERFEQLKSHLLDTKVLDFIKSKVKIKEV